MNKENWSLRLARADDAEKMPAIEQAAGQLFADVSGLSDLAGHAPIPIDRLQRYIRKGHCLVSHRDEEMVGFLVTEPFGRELHIWEMDVHPAAQRSGVGSGLLRACMIDARNSAFRALTLTTFRDVAWNAPFYARLGFEEVTDLDSHPRLASELAADADNGLPPDRRCAMIQFLS